MTHECDVLVIGAGPAGLYAAYYAGFRGWSVVVMDALPEPGGQITAIYTLIPGGKNLVVAYRLEHKRLRKPLEVNMIFDREEEGVPTQD